MTNATSLHWLKAAIAINMIAGGAALAMASHPALAAVANVFLDVVFWPFDGAPRADNPQARFLGAIGGGAFFGWGIASWCVVKWIAPIDIGVARNIILAGLLPWFALDSAGSALSGAYLNVLLNLVILATFLVPLRAIAAASRTS